MEEAEKQLCALMSPITVKYQDWLLQPWQDGWLLHIYKKGEHLHTIGAPDFYSLQGKIAEYLKTTN